MKRVAFQPKTRISAGFRRSPANKPSSVYFRSFAERDNNLSGIAIAGELSPSHLIRCEGIAYELFEPRLR